MNKIISLLLLLSCFSCFAQQSLDDYVGGWSAQLENTNSFSFKIEFNLNPKESCELKFIGQNSITEFELKGEDNQYLVGQFEEQLIVRIDTTIKPPIAFVQTGHHLSNIKLEKSGDNKWVGAWDLLIGKNTRPRLYLSLDQLEDGTYAASSFFKQPTFHYMLGTDFSWDEEEFGFTDIRSNIAFKGVLKKGKIDLTLHFLKEQIVTECLPLPYDEWNIGQGDPSNEPLIIEESSFSKLFQDVVNDTLEGTHSVLISQNGQIVFEQYFDGFTSDTPHDTRSLSKSFASAMVGVSISKNIIENEDVPIKNFLEDQHPKIDWSDGKAAITLHHLMTMSSGLDAIDFGLNRMSYANEGTYQSQENWTEYILSAPMVYKAGAVGNYGSGSPHLLSPILNTQLNERLEFFIHKNLFLPLGIMNYRIQTNNKDLPYFGGGWYFTPKDLMKFGQLYLDGGNWNNKQIIPEKWIAKSMKKHLVLENTIDKNEYGYLFWHKTYEIGSKKIESIESRGSGGQYLFMIPEYNLVAVITSGNYRNNKGFQPEKIMEDYILAEIVKNEK